MKTGLYFLMLAVVFSAAGKQKKPTGQIVDSVAFAHVRSYCVDASDLPENEAYDVKSFVAEESKPGRLLTKIPWKLYPDCREASPDAVIKLQFPWMNVIGIQPGQPQHPQERGVDSDRIKAVLQVLDAESSKVLYKNQADPLDVGRLFENQGSGSDPPVLQRRNAMYGAFWTLAQDVQRVEQVKEPTAGR
jgi:hypothetical protein